MLRTLTLSLLMLVSLVVMLPFASSTAHGLRQGSASQQQRRYRRHSHAWWRRHDETAAAAMLAEASGRPFEDVVERRGAGELERAQLLEIGEADEIEIRHGGVEVVGRTHAGAKRLDPVRETGVAPIELRAGVDDIHLVQQPHRQ